MKKIILSFLALWGSVSCAFAYNIDSKNLISPGTKNLSTWTWVQFTYNGDIWMRNYLNGVAMFDYRLGAGGCLAEMRYCPSSFAALLSPTFNGNETDRVIQETYWGTSANVTVSGSGAPDGRFNVDQAGTEVNLFSPTMSVTRNDTQIDVYSVPQNQWYSVLDSYFTGKTSLFTRYIMQANGVLQVRKVILVASVQNGGVDVGSYDLYYEQWMPFRISSSTFNSMALSLDATGAPNWWYKAGVNLPIYPYWDVATTNGYAVIFRDGAYKTSPVVGVVYGKNGFNEFGTSVVTHNYLNSDCWNNGIAPLPSVAVNSVQPGSVIDYVYYIVPRSSSSASFTTLLNSLVITTPAPAIYGPGYTFTGELATIVSTLTANLTATGIRTNHLGQFAP